jgi:SAM-dependent methyltransferase
MFVLGLNNRLVWRCPTSQLLALYGENVTGRHLEVGVGSGYLLHHCRFPTPQPELDLVDLNLSSLRFARQRLARYPHVRLFRRDVLQPLALGRTYCSVGMNYVLHCVPGGLGECLDRVLSNVGEVLEPGGVLFGATFFREHAQARWLSRNAMALYERKGVFLNPAATLHSFCQALGRHFSRSETQQVGAVTLFRAVR